MQIFNGVSHTLINYVAVCLIAVGDVCHSIPLGLVLLCCNYKEKHKNKEVSLFSDMPTTSLGFFKQYRPKKRFRLLYMSDKFDI